MGNRGSKPTTPDLFSTVMPQEDAPVLSNPAVEKSRPVSRHVLPNDLPNAIKHLGDEEFERLVEAVVAEQKRRGKKPSVPNKGGTTPTIALTTSKKNAIRAAFKARVRPAQIARQFGISKAEIEKVLASG